MEKNNLSNIVKVLEKIFDIGFCDEKAILKMQLTDISKIKNGLSSQEISILIGLQEAIRNKELIPFLSGKKMTKTNDESKKER